MTTISRNEITALAGRLNARVTSVLTIASPELSNDLRTAALVLRAAVRIGFPVSPIVLDDDAVSEALSAAIRTPVPSAATPARSEPGMLRTMTVLVIDEDGLPITVAMAASIIRTVQAAAGA